MTLREQFVADLCKAMSEARKGVFDVNAAMERRLNEPTPQFYISPKRAAEVIYKVKSDGVQILDGMCPIKRQMYLDLISVIGNLREIQEFKNMPIYKLAYTAVQQQAPQFYVSLDTAKQIIKKCSKR